MTSEEMEAGLLFLAESVQALGVGILAIAKVLNEKGVVTEQELNDVAEMLMRDTPPV